MNRREALRTLAAASGGLVALPDWAFGWRPEQLALAHSCFSAAEEAALSAVADTIIPEKDSIGAIAVGVDRFLVRLIDQCYDAEVQENVSRQLRFLERVAWEDTAATFREGSQQRRERWLLSLEASDDRARQDFFHLVKSETIRGFRTSQVVMEGYLGYTSMPGFYDGCAEATTGSTTRCGIAP
jgi:myo-inositol catabolism protein IolC